MISAWSPSRSGNSWSICMDRARRSLSCRLEDVKELSSESRLEAEEATDCSSVLVICGTDMAASAEGELNKLEASGSRRGASEDGAVEDASESS